MQADVMGESTLGVDEMWSDDPIQILHFPFRSHFQKFQTDVHKIMLKYHSKHPYNSITSMVRFYKKYKKQSLPILEFYEKVHQPSIEKDSQNCIGLALYLRRKLLKHLKNEYSDLGSYLFVVSSSNYESPDIPERYHNVPADDTGQFKYHACLALKFTLESENRRGCIILDPGILLDFPIVVMEDGQAPNTGKLEMASLQGIKINEFEYYNENYVYRFDGRERKDRPSHNWIYVGKKLQNVLQIEKRNQIYAYHGLIYGRRAGPDVGIFAFLGSKDHFVAFMIDEDGEDVNNPFQYIIREIPFEYILSEELPRNPDWDKILETLEQKLHYDDSLMDLLKSFSKLATDGDFVQELCRVSLDWSSKIEKSFDS